MKIWRVLLVATLLAACSSGTNRDVAITSLQEEVGFTESEAVCAADALEDEFGSLDFIDDPDSLGDDEALRAGQIMLRCSGAFGDLVGDDADDDAEDAEPEATEPESAEPEPVVTEAAEPVATEPAAADSTAEASAEAVPASAPAPAAPVATEPEMGGDWTADELCGLFDGAEVSQVFGASSPSIAIADWESDDLSVCLWPDPNSESLVPRGMMAARQEAGGSFVQFEEAIDIPGADNADYRPMFLDGRDFLVVEANGQSLSLDYWTNTPGGVELAVAGATRWVAYQNGETPDAASAAQASAPAASTDSASADTTSTASDGALTPDSADPGTVLALGWYWTECAGENPDACDYLYLNGPEGSAYLEFGLTCGGREATNCNALLGDENGSMNPTTRAPGSAAELDALWVSCAAGDGDACDDLYFESPARSQHELYGFTCGGRGAYLDCNEAIRIYGS